MVELNKEEQEQYDKIAVKLTKEEDKEKIGEHLVNLSKCVVNLSKSTGVDIGGKKAKVVVALDYSGSMDTLYRNGTVQETLNKLVPLGLTFDDDGDIELYLFNDKSKKYPALTLDNYSRYKTDVIDGTWSMGMTNYAPVLKDILSDMGKVKKGFLGGIKGYKDTGDDVFIIFITDGNNDDKYETDKIVVESSKTNTFIQFIGIGGSDFSYLEQLDDLGGREIDNTGFSNMRSLQDVSDSELYDTVLSEFAKWLKAREK